MHFHNSLIPRGAYFLLPLESKQEATSGWNFTKCISEVKVNQLKVKNMHVRMGISTFKGGSVGDSFYLLWFLFSPGGGTLYHLYVKSLNLWEQHYILISEISTKSWMQNLYRLFKILISIQCLHSNSYSFWTFQGMFWNSVTQQVKQVLIK